MENKVVPSIIETSDKGVDRSFDIFSRLLKERVVFLTGEIEEVSASLICAQLLALELESTTKANRPILLYINSPGGVVYEAFGIIDMINLLHSRGCDVYTIGNGLCASAGSLILCCGIKRYITPNCRVMIHQPLGGMRGQVTDMEIQAKEAIFIKRRISEMMSERTGKSYETIYHSLERDRYMSAEEAIEFGIVDDLLFHAKPIIKV
jgi:ATP-dependent Clp protease protease subunit